MRQLPANLPSIDKAKLPVSYEQARTALEKAERLDECKTWKDKAAAMASYAKQVRDDSLLKTATRIKARAGKRCGQLLREVEKATGRKNSRATTNSRMDAARAAGLSPHEQRVALEVANVPDDEFERHVESDKPPTLSELAKLGTKAQRPRVDLGGRDLADVHAARDAQAGLSTFASMTAGVTPEVAIRGSFPREYGRMLAQAKAAHEWLGRFLKLMEKQR